MDKMSIRKIIEKDRCNAWVQYRRLSLYLRSTFRYVGDRVRPSLDWANLGTSRDRYLCQLDNPGTSEEDGLADALDIHRFCIYAERICRQHGKVFFVEMVLNPAIARYLLRRGYQKAGEKCFVWEPKDF